MLKAQCIRPAVVCRLEREQYQERTILRLEPISDHQWAFGYLNFMPTQAEATSQLYSNCHGIHTSFFLQLKSPSGPSQGNMR